MKGGSFLKSFAYAFAGLWQATLRERNLRLHYLAAAAVVLLAAWLRINRLEWALLTLIIGAVIAAELFNTSLEAVVDLVSPEYHDAAKFAKDTASAAVLTLSLAAVIIGLLILGPPLYARFFTAA